MNCIERANQAALIALLRKLKPRSLLGVNRFGDVEMTTRAISNRYGVPSDAKTLAVRLTSRTWTVAARVVMHGEDLLAPVAVHSPILSYSALQDDSENRRDEVAYTFNAWLCTCLEMGLDNA